MQTIVSLTASCGRRKDATARAEGTSWVDDELDEDYDAVIDELDEEEVQHSHRHSYSVDSVVSYSFKSTAAIYRTRRKSTSYSRLGFGRPTYIKGRQRQMNYRRRHSGSISRIGRQDQALGNNEG